MKRLSSIALRALEEAGIGTRSVLGKWMLEVAADSEGGGGQGLRSVATIAALATVPAGELANGDLLYLTPLKDYVQFQLNPAFASTSNGITIFDTSLAGTTQYVRMNIPSLDWQLQTTWFIDPLGDDTRSGVSSATSIATWAEFHRRTGPDYNPPDGTVISVSGNVTDTMNLNVEERVGATLFLRGIPVDGLTGAVTTATPPVPAANTQNGFIVLGAAVFAAQNVIRLGPVEDNVFSTVVIAAGAGTQGMITRPRDLTAQANADYPILTDIVTAQTLPTVITGKLTAPPGRVRAQKIRFAESASTGGNENTVFNIAFEACIINLPGLRKCSLDACVFHQAILPGIHGQLFGPMTYRASTIRDGRYFDGGTFIENGFIGQAALDTGDFDVSTANFFSDAADKMVVKAGTNTELTVANSLYGQGVVELLPMAVLRNVANGSTMANAASVVFADAVAGQTTAPPAPGDLAFPAAIAFTTWVEVQAAGGLAVNWSTGARFVRSV